MAKTIRKYTFLLVKFSMVILLVGCADLADDKLELAHSTPIEYNDTISCNGGELILSYQDNRLVSINRSIPDHDERQVVMFYPNGKIKEITIVDGAEWKETSQGTQRIYNIQKITIDSSGSLGYALLTRDYKTIIEREWRR